MLKEKVDILIEFTDSYSFGLCSSIAYGRLHVSDWRRNLRFTGAAVQHPPRHHEHQLGHGQLVTVAQVKINSPYLNTNQCTQI